MNDPILDALTRRADRHEPPPGGLERLRADLDRRTPTSGRRWRLAPLAAAVALIAALVAGTVLLDDDATEVPVTSDGSTPTSAPQDDGPPRPAGGCRTLGGEVRDGSVGGAVGLVESFLDDRAAGADAAPCLAPDAIDAYDGIELCLYDCADGRRVSRPGEYADVPTPMGEDGSALVVSVLVFYGDELVRENYRISDGQISEPFREPASYVDEDTARSTLQEYLDLLSTGAWDDAGALLVNEGVAAQVEAALGEQAFRDPGAALADYCGQVRCDGGVVESLLRIEPYALVWRVRFERDGLVYRQDMGVGMFEGQLTVDAVPQEP